MVQKSQYDESGAVWNRNTFQVEQTVVLEILSLLRVEVELNYLTFKPRGGIVLKNGFYGSRYVKRHVTGVDVIHSCLACLVCIAGKVYPMIEVCFNYRHGDDDWISNNEYYFDLDSFMSCTDSMARKVVFYEETTYPKWFFNLNRDAGTSKPWEIINAPVFIIRPKAGDWSSGIYSIEANPYLRDIGFMRVLDPYTIWQEIDMFMNNQLANEADPGVVPDKYRWIQRGFDEKISFRTRPER
jgi:hypothetical protein